MKYIVLFLVGFFLRTELMAYPFNGPYPVPVTGSAIVSAGGVTNGWIFANLATNLYQPPQEVWAFYDVYGGAYVTNGWVNSAGTSVVVNVASGGGTPWMVAMSNQLKNAYGINLTRADTSLSYPAASTPEFLLNNSASSAMPPYDNLTSTVRWLKNQSPNYTGTNKVFILGPNAAAIVNGPSGQERTNFMAATNVYNLLQADGWNVYLGDWFANNDFWVAYTNQTQAGINQSNYMQLVYNSGYKYIPFWQSSLFYITNPALNADTNYYNNGGNHIGFMGLPGTNIANFFATNVPFYTPKRNPALIPSLVPTIGYLGTGSNFHIDGTNPSVLFYTASNFSPPGGALTNNYIICNGTVSNLPPYTWVDWKFDMDAVSGGNGWRWIIITDQKVIDWQATTGATTTWAKGDGASYTGLASNTVSGPVNVTSGGADHVQISISGTFLTSSNITALQFLAAPQTTNAGNCSLKTGQGFHGVQFQKVPIQGY